MICARSETGSSDNPERALTFVSELIAACESIVRFPLAYPAITAGPYPLRRKVYRRYRIIYRALPTEVRIIAVHHGARDDEPVLTR